MKIEIRTFKIPDVFEDQYINDRGEIVTSNLFLRAVERVVFAYDTAKARGQESLYVCFSGGKDSEALWIVCEYARQKYGVQYTLNYNVTGVDPPELVYFVRREFPDCKRHGYKKSMWRLIVEKGSPPTRIQRFCCAELKERGGEGQICLTGVRWEESINRRKRRPFEVLTNNKATREKFLFNDNDEQRLAWETCTMKRKSVCNPIIDFTEDQVWALIKENNLPYCKLYDEGQRRIGCIGCPMGGAKGMKEDFERYPKFKNCYLAAFDRMLKRYAEKGRATDWKTADDVYNWWVGDEHIKDDRQISMFDDDEETEE